MLLPPSSFLHPPPQRPFAPVRRCLRSSFRLLSLRSGILFLFYPWPLRPAFLSSPWYRLVATSIPFPLARTLFFASLSIAASLHPSLSLSLSPRVVGLICETAVPGIHPRLGRLSFIAASSLLFYVIIKGTPRLRTLLRPEEGSSAKATAERGRGDRGGGGGAASGGSQGIVRGDRAMPAPLSYSKLSGYLRRGNDGTCYRRVLLQRLALCPVYTCRGLPPLPSSILPLFSSLDPRLPDRLFSARGNSALRECHFSGSHSARKSRKPGRSMKLTFDSY